jgi:quercetin dioxygenase-like cupin family protein
MIQYKVDFKGIPWESPIAGMRQKIHKAGSRQLRLVEYAKELTPHWCEKGHMGYVLQGAIEIQFENEVRIYSSGDGISIPHGQEHIHMARVLSDTVTVIFVEDV